MIYLDNAATTYFKPTGVINSVGTALKYLSANPTRSSHSVAVKAGMMVEDTRCAAAKYFGASPDKVIFTLNCTDALNTAIFGTVVKGGHVVTTALEHNSVLRPLIRLKELGLIDYTILSPLGGGFVTAEQIASAVKSNTYMIIVNHISNVTGAVQPIDEIGYYAEKRGLLFLVDGAQSAGYRKIDMASSKISMLAVAPHKGLHAPQGVGMLIIRKGKIRPFRYGGTGTDSAKPQPTELPEALESGTLPTPAIAGLNAAFKYAHDYGESNAKKLSGAFIYTLSELSKIRGVELYTKKEYGGPNIAFNLRSMTSAEAGNILSDEYDICVRCGLHCAPLLHKHYGTMKSGMIRVSLGVDNTIEEINFFLQAIKELSK
ncbi:MAG: aminotransferase class V-fold PLP-dependent enzyme [Clostridia bacterium]|nr:aminotransferase class V-fold PLP-dependent enzyme [Clostridia bacterium]